ncbi:MAG: SprT family zinc-dependent metalloprotease [Candidatus Kapabacteria bacterium]|nr:SprT family zinc-dependent metalloprotease [Candidatus Kapabacteria bacterium]
MFDKLVRSSRRTLSIEINSKLEVIVRSPNRASIADINNFVLKHKNWIDQKKNFIRNKKAAKAPIYGLELGKLLFIGKEYEAVKDNSIKSILNFDGKIFKYNSENTVQQRQSLELWYKLQARKVIENRITIFSDQMNIKYKKWRISNAEHRWGSCSSKGTISLNWRLILAPLTIIDYVVIHELAHLKQMNHSISFWNIVSLYDSNFKSHRNWLKKNDSLLYF